MAGQDIILERAELKEEGDWWFAQVEVPEDAAVLNFVIQYYEHYDNNGGLDYKLALGLPLGIEYVPHLRRTRTKCVEHNYKMGQ
jgi:Starch/carbohydrate-binding module (family 53)